ncbi:MAG: diguanylate cyclase [Lachnospiraceae bacterium]|jgi:diguanylate cyclase (GGDEF)-like protein|nr:diguanylate cyclase [Lachnospiraceae bacterium]MCI9388307.1 diguanylate cyclase [Lachnospiraceae bacterium]MCI9470285.1 diguanylate cyclase [Lachnospiraceae bacterium]
MKKNKILIIDDSNLQTEALKAILEDEYDISISQTAQDGLDNAKNGDFSLILLDVIMPDLDGFNVLKQLQGTLLTKYIPIIMITSLSDAHHEEKGLTLGAVDYIAKPFNPLIVKARVRTHVKLFQYQLNFRQQALVDELTGIANRRSYNRNSRMKWREAVRLGIPFSICMIDVDNFKLYNDTYGHAAGDKVLASVAQTISSHLHRATDYVARYGGEEFVMLLMENDARSSFEFMKRIRRSVEDLHIPQNPLVAKWVTISMGGITLTPKIDNTYDSYAQIADTMLYDAKRYGRNMVVWSNENKEQWCEKEIDNTSQKNT